MPLNIVGPTQGEWQQRANQRTVNTAKEAGEAIGSAIEQRRQQKTAFAKQQLQDQLDKYGGSMRVALNYEKERTRELADNYYSFFEDNNTVQKRLGDLVKQSQNPDTWSQQEQVLWANIANQRDVISYQEGGGGGQQPAPNFDIGGQAAVPAGTQTGAGIQTQGGGRQQGQQQEGVLFTVPGGAKTGPRREPAVRGNLYQPPEASGPSGAPEEQRRAPVPAPYTSPDEMLPGITAPESGSGAQRHFDLGYGQKLQYTTEEQMGSKEAPQYGSPGTMETPRTPETPPAAGKERQQPGPTAEQEAYARGALPYQGPGGGEQIQEEQQVVKPLRMTREGLLGTYKQAYENLNKVDDPKTWPKGDAERIAWQSMLNQGLIIDAGGEKGNPRLTEKGRWFLAQQGRDQTVKALGDLRTEQIGQALRQQRLLDSDGKLRTGLLQGETTKQEVDAEEAKQNIEQQVSEIKSGVSVPTGLDTKNIFNEQAVEGMKKATELGLKGWTKSLVGKDIRKAESDLKKINKYIVSSKARNRGSWDSVERKTGRYMTNMLNRMGTTERGGEETILGPNEHPMLQMGMGGGSLEAQETRADIRKKNAQAKKILNEIYTDEQDLKLEVERLLDSQKEWRAELSHDQRVAAAENELAWAALEQTRKQAENEKGMEFSNKMYDLAMKQIQPYLDKYHKAEANDKVRNAKKWWNQQLDHNAILKQSINILQNYWKNAGFEVENVEAIFGATGLASRTETTGFPAPSFSSTTIDQEMSPEAKAVQEEAKKAANE